jgi:hypothetical protein
MGPHGPGEKGPTGPTGDTGATGLPSSIVGNMGAPGATGDTGAMGDVGAVGSPGLVGPSFIFAYGGVSYQGSSNVTMSTGEIHSLGAASYLPITNCSYDDSTGRLKVLQSGVYEFEFGIQAGVSINSRADPVTIVLTILVDGSSSGFSEQYTLKLCLENGDTLFPPSASAFERWGVISGHRLLNLIVNQTVSVNIQSISGGSPYFPANTEAFYMQVRRIDEHQP